MSPQVRRRPVMSAGADIGARSKGLGYEANMAPNPTSSGTKDSLAGFGPRHPAP
jgi:hypothetical protein